MFLKCLSDDNPDATVLLTPESTEFISDLLTNQINQDNCEFAVGVAGVYFNLI